MAQVVIATGGFDRQVKFWESTGAPRSTIKIQDSQVNCIQVSWDKKLLAVGGNPSIYIYEVEKTTKDEAKPLYTLGGDKGHTGNVTAIGFHKDGQWLYSGSEDGTVRIWDLRRESAQQHTIHRYPPLDYCVPGALTPPIQTVILHPNQSSLIFGDGSGCIRIWDLEKESRPSVELNPVVDVGIQSLCMSRDGRTLVAGSMKGIVYVYILQLEEPEQQQQQPQQQEEEGGLEGGAANSTPVESVFSRRGEQEIGKFKLVYQFQAHDEYLLRCVMSPDSRLVATTSADKSIKLWSTENWDGKPWKTLSQHQRWVWDAVFSADSSYLISASSDQTAKLWKVATGEVLRTYIGHSLAVTCVCLNDIPTERL